MREADETKQQKRTSDHGSREKKRQGKVEEDDESAA